MGDHVSLMVVPYSKVGADRHELPVGAFAAMVDTTEGITNVVNGSLSFSASDPTSFASTPNAKHALREAIADTLDGVTWNMVHVIDVTARGSGESIWSKNTVHGRDLQASDDVWVLFNIYLPTDNVVTDIEASDISASSLTTNVNKRLVEQGIKDQHVENVIVGGAPADQLGEKDWTDGAHQSRFATVALAMAAVFAIACL